MSINSIIEMFMINLIFKKRIRTIPFYGCPLSGLNYKMTQMTQIKWIKTDLENFICGHLLDPLLCVPII